MPSDDSGRVCSRCRADCDDPFPCERHCEECSACGKRPEGGWCRATEDRLHVLSGRLPSEDESRATWDEVIYRRLVRELPDMSNEDRRILADLICDDLIAQALCHEK